MEPVLNLNIWFEKCADAPLHLPLALSNAKSTVPYRHADNRCQLVAAALLHTIGVAELVDIDACIKRLDENN